MCLFCSDSLIMTLQELKHAGVLIATTGNFPQTPCFGWLINRKKKCICN